MTEALEAAYRSLAAAHNAVADALAEADPEFRRLDELVHHIRGARLARTAANTIHTTRKAVA